MANDEPERVAFDSCVLIHWATGAEAWTDIVQQWLQLASTGQVTLGASAAILVEARGGGRLSPNPAAESQIRRVIDGAFQLVHCNRSVALRARELAIQHGLKTWDAVHLASAEYFQAEYIFTTDKDLLSVGSVGMLEVCEPFRYGGPNLFDF